ncbi:PTS system, cellobiose-specific IIB component [Clostridium cavendishii DSM 21758]|uniref:PTS system, cellobiose-specific IIB component n=1 Tax=Clostridium cavendishii DSM 21758 TaxID=1121302 RepID=A0A1M6U914_9CLOT|nr:PTS sugar transporter subunit IIB [Clostridium cavendishii]SHK65640.1 PTS system, cellobiose-specific IIB component [Clostridium cavendishii DSM 21758]
MKRILLVCSAGMSTSLLVSKMQASAKEQGVECWINAVGEAELRKHEDNIDILLLGPQVRFLLNKMKTKFEPKGIPVEVINTVDYGTMNGAKVLKHALDVLNK